MSAQHRRRKAQQSEHKLYSDTIQKENKEKTFKKSNMLNEKLIKESKLKNEANLITEAKSEENLKRRHRRKYEDNDNDDYNKKHEEVCYINTKIFLLLTCPS